RSPQTTLRNIKLAMNRIRIHVLPSSRNRVPQTPRPQEPQAALSLTSHALSPALKAWSSASNIFWRTRMPHTSNAAMSLPKWQAMPECSTKGGKEDGWVRSWSFI
uniref:Uncharacterized protein n=1 Tax=Sphaeramia orbicularis TaxID=375764 RepID=A0A673ASY9_9TELE